MKKFLVAVTTFAAILVSAAPVHAVSFDFSFTNQFPLGGVNGTVTGRIDGKKHNKREERSSACEASDQGNDPELNRPFLLVVRPEHPLLLVVRPERRRPHLIELDLFQGCRS